MTDTSGAPQYTPENWLSPADPNLVYGNILPYSFRPDAQGHPVPGSVNWALPNFLRSAVNDLALTVAAPRNAALGKYTDAEMQGLAPAMTSTLMGLGLPMPAPAGASRIFAGLNARTANFGNLDRALETYAADEGGKPPMWLQRGTWANTGWYLDHDGQWKWEIPDAGEASLKAHPNLQVQTPGGTISKSPTPKGWDHVPGSTMVRLPANQPTRLGDLLDHPKLFEAYPEFENMPVWGKAPDDQGAWGTYHPSLQAISLAPMEKDQMLSTLLHEVQHGVQHREGFTFGGNQEQFLPKGFYQKEQADSDRWDAMQPELMKTANWIYGPARTISKFLKGEDLYHHEDVAIDKLINDNPDLYHKAVSTYQDIRDNKKIRDESYQKYLGIAGEVEARNVQERFAQGLVPSAYPPGMGPPHPWMTTGYHSGQQSFQWPGPWKEGLAMPPKGQGELPGMGSAEGLVNPSHLVPVDHDPWDQGGWP